MSHRRAPFQAAIFPREMVQRDFHIVTSDQGFVMLAVNVEHVTDTYISQLFSSNEDGSVYRLVLSNLRNFNKKQNNLSSNTIYTSDVHDVKGLKGCFLANQHRRLGSNNLSFLQYNLFGDIFTKKGVFTTGTIW